MKQPFIKKLRIPTYKAPLWIIVHPSIPKAIDFTEDLINTRILSDRDRRGTKAFAFGYEDDNGARKFMLFLRPSASPGEIAHECKHLLNNIFRWYGVSLSLTNDEPECYYLEDLVDTVHRVLRRFKDKTTKNKLKSQYKFTQTLASNEIIT